jgi:hypothetical protein
MNLIPKRWRKKKPVTKPLNKEFIDYANTKKLREFNTYLKSVSRYFNNPLNELLKQRGMLLELTYAGKANTPERNALRGEVHKIDGMIERLMASPENK